MTGKNIISALLMSWLVVHSSFAAVPSVDPHQALIESSLQHHGAGFASLEHQKYGDKISLRWAPFNTPEYLQLPNGLRMTYGEIIMFAGDLFGNPTKPISSCAPQHHNRCFLDQFAALALAASTQACDDPLQLVTAYREYFKKLDEQLAAAQQQGQTAWDFYKQHDKEDTAILNRISCGGSALSNILPLGTYLKLSQANLDHFVPDSLLAYKAGHRVALQSALQAHRYLHQGLIDQAKQTLHLAYAQNAFANHYLTDSMSSGHMRTPRRALHNDIALPALLNLVIANLMHNEDSSLGLMVVNSHGMSWRAYGDGYLQHPDARTHQEMLIMVMQLSADAIYTTFRDGKLPDSYEEMSWLPDYAKIKALNNHSPLFKIENGRLLKRQQNHNPYDFHWTAYWSGLLTLLDFEVVDGVLENLN